MKIIHISDLHYRSNWDEEIGVVFDKFLEDLSNIIDSSDDWRLIFSGDLVQSGSESPLYQELLDNLGSRLDQIGIGPDKRYLVPGNHDVSQIEVSNRLLAHRGSLSQLNDERSFNDAVLGELKDMLRPKFENYFNFGTQFVAPSNLVTSISGGGLDLNDKIGIYFLNTALTSHGGVKDTTGRVISDEGVLGVETRSLHRWLASSKHEKRILVMHHPCEWLAPWAREEIEEIIHDKFCAVMSGHVHKQKIKFVRIGFGSAVHCSAPPLFTRKSEALGYTIAEITNARLKVTYRQWHKPSGFVLGTLMAGNDSGIVEFPFDQEKTVPQVALTTTLSTRPSPIEILKRDFEEAATCYSSYQGIWIERDFSDSPEHAPKGSNATIYSISDLISVIGNVVIRAPHEFGLTSVGRQYALQYASRNSRYLLYLDFKTIQPHRASVEAAIKLELDRTGIREDDLDGFVIDDVEIGKQSRRFLKSIEELFGKKTLIILSPREETHRIVKIDEGDQLEGFKSIYLWTLSRPSIRRLVETYGIHCKHLDYEALAKKVIADLDTLNIPRTPINCLTLIKINEQDAEESPVNRTEMVRRVFSLFFIQFEGLPRYASRPDMLDSEYALGVFTEFLIRENRGGFTKQEFFDKISAYCKSQILNIEADVLFLILTSEGIITRRDGKFEFRFSFWLYFFAAHRMHHSPDFAKYILSDRRYAAFPLILEFYSGLDRRRSDAVLTLINDLREMEQGFRKRSGIPIDLNPYIHAEWRPTDEIVEAMEQEVIDGVSLTTLPPEVKDELADRGRDRSKAYHQEIAQFVEESTMHEYVSAMLGASRVLRNSDHVDPVLRKQLLECVLQCWVGFCHIILILSSVLIGQGNATFEGIGFFLDESFDDKSPEEKLYALMRVIPYNVSMWFHEEIFSKKLGPLLVDYLKNNNSSIGGLLGRRVLVTQRPIGWKQAIKEFMLSENKNSFSLFDINNALRHELRYGIMNEKTGIELRDLSATALAKHYTGKKRPDQKLIGRVAADIAKEDKEFRDTDEH